MKLSRMKRDFYICSINGSELDEYIQNEFKMNNNIKNKNIVFFHTVKKTSNGKKIIKTFEENLTKLGKPKYFKLNNIKSSKSDENLTEKYFNSVYNINNYNNNSSNSNSSNSSNKKNNSTNLYYKKINRSNNILPFVGYNEIKENN